MVELALHGPVEVCLFSLLCSDILIDSGRGGGCLSCWSRFEVQENCLFTVVVEFLEYILFVAFSECMDSWESVTASWFVLTLSSIH